jgi:hypothetical protein
MYISCLEVQNTPLEEMWNVGRVIIMSMLLHGSKCWTLTTEEMRRLRTTGMFPWEWSQVAEWVNVSMMKILLSNRERHTWAQWYEAIRRKCWMELENILNNRILRLLYEYKLVEREFQGLNIKIWNRLISNKPRSQCTVLLMMMIMMMMIKYYICTVINWSSIDEKNN